MNFKPANGLGISHSGSNSSAIGIDPDKVKETSDAYDILAEKIERELRMRGESEVNSTVIGEIVMKYLEQTDQIAYVRFASVYRQFADVNNFMQELQRIMSKNNLNDQTENK